MPKWYVDRPPIGRGDDFYLRAFWELSSCRGIGMGVVGPIPWNVVVEYGERFGLADDVMDVFVTVIREMDEAYVEHCIEQRKRAESN